MTVGELLLRLSNLDPSHEVMIEAAETGWASVAELVQLKVRPTAHPVFWDGPYESAVMSTGRSVVGLSRTTGHM